MTLFFPGAVLNIPTLREEIRKAMISEILKNLPHQKKITLWQSLDMRKDYLQVKLAKIDEEKAVLKFFTKDSKHAFKFDSKKYLYFYEAKRTFIFKSKISFQSAFELELRIPEFIMIEDLRQEVRRSGILEQLYVQFKCSHPNALGVMEKKVLDYGTGGFSVIVNSVEAKHLYQGDLIQVLTVSNDTGSNLERVAKIVHTNHYFDGEKYLTNKIKVGFNFL